MTATATTATTPPPARTIPGVDVEAIRERMPLTHEIGGTMRFGDDGRLAKTTLVRGDRCRAEDGTLLKSGGICTLRHAEAPVTWHTHPIANRPSSADLRISVLRDARAGGVRECNLLFTPKGLWTYRPSEAMCLAWRDADHDMERAAWRYLGHHFQEATQRGECDGFVEALRKEGFEVSYVAYGDVGREVTLR